MMTMSDPVLITILTGMQTILLAVIGLIATWLNKNSNANHQESLQATKTLTAQVDGKMEQLLRVTKETQTNEKV